MPHLSMLNSTHCDLAVNSYNCNKVFSSFSFFENSLMINLITLFSKFIVASALPKY